MKRDDFINGVWVKVRMNQGAKGRRTRRLPLTKQQVGWLVDTVLDSVTEVLEQEGEIHFPSFGKFTIKRFPAGGKVVMSWKGQEVSRRPDRLRTVRFKPAKSLLNRVNRSVAASA